MDNKVVL